jgi:protein-tyrosine phosphatase
MNTRKKRLLSSFLSIFLPLSIVFADTPQRILFVCGGNTGRSPMAESLANNYFKFPQYGYNAFSRGINVNPDEIMPEQNAVTVMYEWSNISDIVDHRATPVTMADINQASVVLAMTVAQKEKLLALNPTAAHKIFTLSQCANGTSQDVNDMYGHDLAFYQKTSKQIADYLQLIKQHGFSCQGSTTKQSNTN